MTRYVPGFLLPSLGVLACAAALTGAAAVAADGPRATNDPKALELLGEVARAYKALPAYSDRGEFVTAVTVNGKSQKGRLPMHLTLARPNKLDFDLGEVRLVSDGTTLTTIVGPFKKYATAPAPRTITFDTFRDGPVGSLLLGGPGGPTSAIFLSLLVDPDAVKAITGGEGVLKLEPDQKVGEATLRSLLIDQPKGADFRLLIDPATRLLRGIDWVVDPKEVEADAPEGQKLVIDRIAWTPGAVSTEAPKEDAFAYKAPKGFTKLEAMEKPAGEAAKNPLEELVGKPAPEFNLTVLEPSGKTRTVAKADLAGKVVLIDFWATWCPPCRAELPEIQKMIEAYAKEKKEVVIVLQSLDTKPREIPDLQKLIEKTFEEEKVAPTGTPVGLLAVDPVGTISESFQIEALPSLVILDGKGVVQAAYVGKQSREDLARDIDTLLEGKSLVTPKPRKADAP